MPVTDDPADPRLTHGSDTGPVPMAQAYLVLSDEERAKGFVRPLYMGYRHQDLECGAVTFMNVAIAETYARKPSFYGATYCAGCRMHRPVGAEGEFTWVGQDGGDTRILVGT